MAITSVGYAGTVGDAQWAAMISRVGKSAYSVDDYASFRVTVGAGTRALAVASGKASAFGVYDTSNAIENVTLASVPSGTRWDLVVLRRTWATKVTAVAVIQGGSTKALPTWTTTPGAVVDQPLALARVIAGSTVVQEIVDLRCISGDGGLSAFDDLARSYMTQLGTSVRIGDVVWNRGVNVSGSSVWTFTDVTPDTGWVDISKNSGWSWGFGQARRIGSQISVRINAVRNQGWAVGNQLAALTGPFRPDVDWYAGSTASAGKTEFRFKPDGGVVASQVSGGATGVTIHTTFPAVRPV